MQQDILSPSSLLDVEDLFVEYVAETSTVRACAGVGFSLKRGEMLGIVGESGSGKSTLVTALTRLERPPAVITRGRIIFRPSDGGEFDLAKSAEKDIRRYRWSHISAVFQSGMDSLNPVVRLGSQFVDVIRANDRTVGERKALERARELLSMVGIDPERSRSYAHELSGGMRQRATIALALACRPELVVMDEPTTAVDVVVQHQILERLADLRAQLGFAVILVSHDLSLLIEWADRIGVMYAGRLIEINTSDALFRSPKHPYTNALLGSLLTLHEPQRDVRGITGSPPDLRALPSGCAFHPRCELRLEGICEVKRPVLQSVEKALVACHLYQPDSRTSTRSDA